MRWPTPVMIACLAASWATYPRDAGAAFVSGIFTGTVTYGSFEFSGYPGSAVAGTFGYDTAAPPLAGSTATMATYATGSLSFAIPAVGFSFAGATTLITVFHDPGFPDQLIIDSTSGPSSEAGLTITDPTGMSFASAGLPTSLGFAPGTNFDLRFIANRSYVTFDVAIAALGPSAVPEPASGLMLGLGLVGVSFVGWIRLTGRPLALPSAPRSDRLHPTGPTPMKLPRPRFTIRRLMILVAVVGVVAGVGVEGERRRSRFRRLATAHYWNTVPPHRQWNWMMYRRYAFAGRFPWLPMGPDPPRFPDPR